MLLTTLFLRSTHTHGAHGSAEAATEDNNDTAYAAPYSAAAAARFGTLTLSGCTRARDGEAAARAVDAGLRLMAGFDFARARLAFQSGHGDLSVEQRVASLFELKYGTISGAFIEPKQKVIPVQRKLLRYFPPHSSCPVLYTTTDTNSSDPLRAAGCATCP